MRFTQKANAALFLGADMARAAWPAFGNRYPDKLVTMRERVCVLELDEKIHLPDEHAKYKEQYNALVAAIHDELAKERTFLGGDGFALPFFVLAVALHTTVSSLALGESVETGTSLINNALLDLGVHADEAKLEALLRLETEWIRSKGTGDDTEVREQDVFMAWARVTHQLLERWHEAERRRASDLPEIGLDDVPLYSCFISYNGHDEAFCNRLYERLRLIGVRVWYAPDRMMAGDQIARQLDGGLETHDKLVLVLSETSINSDWVQYEISTALSVGGVKGENVLVPIALMDPARLKHWELVDRATGKDLAEHIRGMLIPNFADWEQSGPFDVSFDQLHRALRRLHKAVAATQ